MEDKEIVKKILENPENLSILIKKYEQPLRRYIRRITNIHDEEIEDLLQDVFISVYQNINSYDFDLSFSSWIYRIAHNKTINYWKKNKNNLDSLPFEDNLVFIEKVFRTESFVKEFEAEEKRQKILEALNNLDKKYSEVLYLKFVEDKDYKEISDILEKPMGTIATLINRGKKALKKEFEKNNLN